MSLLGEQNSGIKRHVCRPLSFNEIRFPHRLHQGFDNSRAQNSNSNLQILKMQFLNILTLSFSLLPLRVLSSPVLGSVDSPAQEARSITVPDTRAVVVDRDEVVGPYDVPVPIELTLTKRAVEEMSERDASADKLFARESQSSLATFRLK